MSTKHESIYILAVLFSFTFLSGFVLSSTFVFAESAVDNVSVVIPESCTFSTSSSFGENYNVSIPSGHYENNIGKTRLSVFCNNNDSFAIYAVGYSNDTLGNNEMVAMPTSANNIAAGTATSGDTSNWAMKLEAIPGAGASGSHVSHTPTIVSPFNNFAAVPSTWSKVAEATSITGATNEAAVDASYAVYVSSTQPAASYQGKVRYTVVHPSTEVPLGPVVTTAGKIGYVPNASGVVDTMGDQNIDMTVDQSKSPIGIVKYFGEALAPTCLNNSYSALFNHSSGEAACFNNDVSSSLQPLSLNVADIEECIANNHLIGISQPGSYLCGSPSISPNDVVSIAGNIFPPCLNGATEFNGFCIIVDGDTVTPQKTILWTPNFRRPGYGFAGWSDKFDWEFGENDENGNGTGVNVGYHIYGPNETILPSNDAVANGLSLYAVWVKSAGNLQNWNGCSSMNVGDITALTDIRDNDTYAVAKLKDDKCWMIENLRLDNTVTLNNENTNNPAPGFTNLTLNNSDWCTDDTAACVDQALVNTNNTSNSVAMMTKVGENTYGSGNYYSWYSATAGTGTYSLNSGDAPGSICPTGWKLPTSSGVIPSTIGGYIIENINNDFYKLQTAVVGNAPYVINDYFGYHSTSNGPEASESLRKHPNNFITTSSEMATSGIIDNAVGSYWSSTTLRADRAGDMTFYRRMIVNAMNEPRTSANSIRCLAN